MKKVTVRDCMNCELYKKGCEKNCYFDFPESMAISHNNIKEIKRKHEKM